MRSRPSHLVATSIDHGQRLKQDMESILKRILAEEPQLTPEQAVLKAQQELLTNNPFVPPKDGRCIINSLPVELLAHIFRVGALMEGDGGDDEFEEVGEGEEKNALQNELKKRDGSGKDEEEDEDKMQGVDEVVEEDDGNDEEWEDEPSEHDHDDDEDEDEYSDEDDEDEGPVLPFQVLVSHVCQQWRNTAINSPELWNIIDFVAPAKWDKYKAYLERAKGQPLTLVVDGTSDEPDTEDEAHEHEHDHGGCCGGHDGGPKPSFNPSELEQIMDLIVPFAPQWYQVEFDCTNSSDMEMVLKRLHDIPEAPLLEGIHLHDEELATDEVECQESDFINLTVPFHGKAPKLDSINLWGVHLDWDACIPLFQNLKELNLAYHIKRPSFRTFATYLKNSPNLKYLELDMSGPALVNPTLLVVPETPATGVTPAYTTPVAGGNTEEEEDPYEWPRYPLEVPSMRDLSLGGHEPNYALALATKFFFPKIRTLSLDYSAGDFTEAVQAYINPVRGASSRRSIFSMLLSLQIIDLGTVRAGVLKDMLESLVSLQTISLNAEGYEEAETVPDEIWRLLSSNAEMVKGLVEVEGPVKDLEDVPMKEALTDGAEATEAARPKNAHPKLFLPTLTALQSESIPGDQLRNFVANRKAAGVPLKSLLVHEETEIDDDDERWLRDNLEEFDYFSGSEGDEYESDEDGLPFDIEVDGDEDEWQDTDEDGSAGDAHDGGSDDEWVDEEDDGLVDDIEDEVMVDEEGGGGRVARARNVPHVSGDGAVGGSVTTGLENLD